LQRKLKEREELRVVGSNSKSLDLPAEYISEQSRLELKAQAKKWSAIDDKMEVSLRVSSSYDLGLWKHCVIYTLQKHRHLGNLKQSTNEEVITKLRAPQEARLPHIREIIERAVSIRTVSKYYMLSRTYKYCGRTQRREYILRRETERKALVSKSSVFSYEDAINLIKGKDDIADKVCHWIWSCDSYIMCCFGTIDCEQGEHENSVLVAAAGPVCSLSVGDIHNLYVNNMH
jgi:hypothetical protein